jgi:ribosome-associated protein
MPISINHTEVALSAIRAQGAGGQNVNKVSSAIHLRFDVGASSLPDEVKARLLHLRDQRVTQEGVLVIKAQRYRTQEANRQDALQRLQAWVNLGAHVPRARKATQPTFASRQRRLEGKTLRGQTKATRSRVLD